MKVVAIGLTLVLVGLAGAQSFAPGAAPYPSPAPRLDTPGQCFISKPCPNGECVMLYPCAGMVSPPVPAPPIHYPPPQQPVCPPCVTQPVPQQQMMQQPPQSRITPYPNSPLGPTR